MRINTHSVTVESYLLLKKNSSDEIRRQMILLFVPSMCHTCSRYFRRLLCFHCFTLGTVMQICKIAEHIGNGLDMFYLCICSVTVSHHIHGSPVYPGCANGGRAV